MCSDMQLHTLISYELSVVPHTTLTDLRDSVQFYSRPHMMPFQTITWHLPILLAFTHLWKVWCKTSAERKIYSLVSLWETLLRSHISHNISCCYHNTSSSLMHQQHPQVYMQTMTAQKENNEVWFTGTCAVTLLFGFAAFTVAMSLYHIKYVHVDRWVH